MARKVQQVKRRTTGAYAKASKKKTVKWSSRATSKSTSNSFGKGVGAAVRTITGKPGRKRAGQKQYQYKK